MWCVYVRFCFVFDGQGWALRSGNHAVREPKFPPFPSIPTESSWTQEYGLLGPISLLYLTHGASSQDLASVPLQLWPLDRVKPALPGSKAKACSSTDSASHHIIPDRWHLSLVTVVSQLAYVAKVFSAAFRSKWISGNRVWIYQYPNFHILKKWRIFKSCFPRKWRGYNAPIKHFLPETSPDPRAPSAS